MRRTGFQITRLTLAGRGVENAEVSLTAGLNVIVGPSDTGKTFIFQCLDFMLGGSHRPKEIPEGTQYQRLRMDGLTASGLTFSLERSLQGGEFVLRPDDAPERTLKAKHDSDREDTISHFLLELSGLTDRSVRVNQHGKTRGLSFRDVVRLIMVDEESIIGEASPALSGQYTSRTAEKSVFRLLLSGVGDTEVAGVEDPKLVRARGEGKSQAMAVLVDRALEELREIGVEGNTPRLEDHRDRLAAQLARASEVLLAEQGAASVLETERQEAWSRLRKAESRRAVLQELRTRFDLLKQQYVSDLMRLEVIAEAGVRLGQMREERCPICGARAEHHEVDHRNPEAGPEDVASACRAEAAKIRVLTRDLDSTITVNNAEIERLEEDIRQGRSTLEAATRALQSELQPRLRAAVQLAVDSQAELEKYRRAIDLRTQIEEMERLAHSPAGDAPTGLSPLAGVWVGTGEADLLGSEVESTLREWRFPNLSRVAFSEADWDLVISGRKRASYGKGLRAITHAAFTIALLRLCQKRQMPHPGLVVIDSPLVVYREPDIDERGFTHEVRDAFYRSLAASGADCQVIIIENEEPPADLAHANVIRFSGAARGREGFIPRMAS